MSINPYAIVQPVSDEMDLFGEEDDTIPQPMSAISKPSVSQTPSVDEHTGLTDDDDIDQRKRRKLEYGEDDEEPPQIQKATATNHTLQNVGLPRSSDGNYWQLRLPHYLHSEARPFRPDTFQPIENRGDIPGTSNTDKSLSIKFELANTIRWRWVKSADGNMVKQSNARVIKWDDGTMSLQLGKEMFDITTSVDNPASSTPSQSQSQSQTFSQGSKSTSRSQAVSYIVTQHPYETLLQAEAAITGAMSLQPVGMESQSHRQLARVVSQKHSKVSKLRFASETMLAEAEKAQEALKKGARGSRTRSGLGGDDAARKKRRVSGYEKQQARRRNMGGYSDDDDSGVEDDGRAQSNVKGIGEYMEDEFLVADSDEGDDYGVPRRSSKKKKGDDDLEDLDVLEEAEEKLERMAKNRNKDDMDLDEDEDDEEAHNAIRKSSGKRKGVSLIEDSDQE